MNTKYKDSGRALLVSSWLFLALLDGHSPSLYAEERQSGSSVIECKETETTNKNGQPTVSIHPRKTLTRLVGPSAEEIHDFLYPPVEDCKVSTPAN